MDEVRIPIDVAGGKVIRCKLVPLRKSIELLTLHAAAQTGNGQALGAFYDRFPEDLGIVEEVEELSPAEFFELAQEYFSYKRGPVRSADEGSG